MVYSTIDPEIEIRKISGKITCIAKIKIQLSLMKILLIRVGNATTAIYTRKKARAQEKNIFRKRGGDYNDMMLLITRVN